jgi:hypothetical protein
MGLALAESRGEGDVTDREILARAIARCHGIDWRLWLDVADACLSALRERGRTIVPEEPTQEMRIAAVEALARTNEPFAERMRAEGEVRAWAALLMASSRETDAVWRAMLSAVLSE